MLKMKSLLLMLTPMIIAVHVFGTASNYMLPSRLHFEYDDYGVDLVIVADSDKEHIKDIRFKINGKSVKVPKMAYSDLKWPILHTVQMLATPPVDEELGASLEISFEVGNEDERHNYIPTTVSILYYQNKNAFLQRYVKAANETGYLKSGFTLLKP